MFPIRDHNPSGRTPYVTYALIALNVGIFMSYYDLFVDDYQLAMFFQNWALIPAHVSSGEGYTGFLSSMFLHAGWMHLFGNMLFLFIFGDNMEDEMGHVPYLLFYLSSGVVAGLVQYMAAPYSMVPTVGASGAIAGVMGGYLLLFPKAKVDIFLFFIVFFRIIPVPSWLVLVLWFVFQVNGGIGDSGEAGGVAYWAHAGGFVAGMVMTVPLWLRMGGRRFWNRTEGHPPHPEGAYPLSRTHIPTVRRK
ncbi:MAG: rhomboid family intramembrane serine protease [Roseivivax sp.]|nr:rhomboid family intramembrane serine protease [Roseivivax sp.]